MPVDPITNEPIEDAVEAPTSVLDLSDEEFSKLPLMEDPADATPEPGPDPDGSDPAADVGDDPADPGVDSDVVTNTDDDPGDAPDPETTKDLDPAGTGADDDKVKDDPKPEKIDYQAEYEKLTQPFKANGGEIQVKNTDEIITLMQMGANYHKKMAALKPSIKLVKLLERHGLTDETQLGYLIDLSKKDPAAIQKLVKESGIDPLDIDVSADSTYKSKVAPISEAELQIDAVIDEIKESPTYARTLQVVAGDWDVPSRNAVATNPQIIKVINEQIGNGIYDKVMGEVERARQFGKLQGVSDFEAYKQVGDWMSNQGMLQPPAPTAPVKTNTEADVMKKKQDEEKRNAQRKAAGAPPVKKSVAPVAPKTDILGLSDEEFMKLPASAYTKIK